MRNFLHSLWHGAALAAIFGGVGALVVGGVTALFSGPTAVMAAIGAGLLGLFGAGGSAVDASTSGRGDWRASWLSGVPMTALLAYGVYTGLDNKPPPAAAPQQAVVSRAFNAGSSDKGFQEGGVKKAAAPASAFAEPAPR